MEKALASMVTKYLSPILSYYAQYPDFLKVIQILACPY